MPARCPSAGRRRDGVDGDAASAEEPRDDRVGVPHLAGAKLVAAPDRGRELAYAGQKAAGDLRIVRQPARTVDGFADIGNHAVAPAPHLVAEDPRTRRPARAHRALDDHAALGSAPIPHRSLLDHEPALAWNVDDERRVVEMARPPVGEPRRHRLEDAPIQPHRHASGAQRQPVEIDGSPCRAARCRSRSHASIRPGRAAHGIGTWTEPERAENPHAACERPPMCSGRRSPIVEVGNDRTLAR